MLWPGPIHAGAGAEGRQNRAVVEARPPKFVRKVRVAAAPAVAAVPAATAAAVPAVPAANIPAAAQAKVGIGAGTKCRPPRPVCFNF